MQKTAPLLSLDEASAVIKTYRLAQSEEARNHAQLPKVVFQYWDQDPPEQIQRLLTHNRRLCEQHGITHVLFNDEMARALLQAHFAPGVLAVYDAAPHPAMKCDLFRLCYLSLHGGMYVDADLALSDVFFIVFEQRCELLVFQWDIPERHNICNWLIACTPNSELMHYVMQTTCNNTARALAKGAEHALKNILAVSGPGIFTRGVGSQIKAHPGDPSSLPILVFTMDLAYTLVHNGPRFLKAPLAYKASGTTHWLNAATATKTPGVQS